MKGKRTPLFDLYPPGVRLTSFAGWELALHFGSIVEEHLTVRRRAGLFDVSHMAKIRVRGERAASLLQLLLTADVGRMAVGRCAYSLMCREDGGCLDDLIACRVAAEEFLVVGNAANREKDLAWFRRWSQAVGGAEVEDGTEGMAALALQGPEARSFLPRLAKGAEELPPFGCAVLDGAIVSRTGYTGEDGFELFLPPSLARQAWEEMIGRGVRPCGLGARDTLRLEAALPLYGQDLAEETNPLEAGLGRFVCFEKGDFVGSRALREVREKGPARIRIGLVLEGGGGAPAGARLHHEGREVGRLTSTGYSPCRRTFLGLGLVERGKADLDLFQVEGRGGKTLRGRRVPLPFYRRGECAGGGEAGVS